MTWPSVWHQVGVDMVGGKSALDFIIDASLMRPRYMIKLFEDARRRALKLGNQRIREEDYFVALDELGWNIVEDLSIELSDIMTTARPLLFDLGRLKRCGEKELKNAIAKRVGATDAVIKVIDVLLWSGAMGISTGSRPIFIYNCGYKLQFLQSTITSGTKVEFFLHETLANCLSKAEFQ